MAILTKRSELRRRVPVPSQRMTKRTSHRWTRYSSITFYAFASPWLLGFLCLTVFPLLYALLVSFSNFDGLSQQWRWVGLANYQELIHDPDTWYSLTRTLLYTIISVPISIVAGLALALLLNQRVRAVGLFRTIFYLPSVVPIVASAIMWKLIFDTNTGAMNAILERFHVPNLSWLLDPYAFLVLIVLVLWGLGGGMVISLAALQGLPNELLEAATIDGANTWQTLRTIVIPLLSPALFFQLVIGVIAAMQVLIQPLLLAPSPQGSPDATYVPRGNYLYMVHVYTQFFDNQRFGYGSALLWVLFALILLFTLLIFRSSTLWVYYEVER